MRVSPLAARAAEAAVEFGLGLGLGLEFKFGMSIPYNTAVCAIYNLALTLQQVMASPRKRFLLACR